MKIKKIAALITAASLLLSATAFAAVTKDNTKLNKVSVSRRQKNDIVFDEFISGEEGGMPIGWSKVASAGAVELVKADTGKYGEKLCLKLTDRDASGNGVTATYGISELSTGIIGFETRFKYQQGDSAQFILDILLRNKAGKNVVTSYTSSANRSFTVRNGSSSIKAMPIIMPDVWYTVKYYINLDAGIFDVSLYDESQNTYFNEFDFSFATDQKSEAISTIALATETYTGEVLYDYVRISKETMNLQDKLEADGLEIEKGCPVETISAPVSKPVSNRVNIKLNGRYMFTSKKPVVEGEEVYITAKNMASFFNMSYVKTVNGILIKGEKNELLLPESGNVIKFNKKDITLRSALKPDGKQIFVPLGEICNLLKLENKFDKEVGEMVIVFEENAETKQEAENE